MIASLSEVKSKLSAFIRISRAKGEPVVITVHGVPTAELRAFNHIERQLTDAEVIMMRAFVNHARSKLSAQDAFCAVQLLKENRR